MTTYPSDLVVKVCGLLPIYLGSNPTWGKKGRDWSDWGFKKKSVHDNKGRTRNT